LSWRKRIAYRSVRREPSTAGVEISVAPLTLPGLSNVCFDLTVLNGAPTPDGDNTNDPDTVWSKSSICSSTYGNGAGGDITYIGACDAGVSAHNFVLLTLADVFAGRRPVHARLRVRGERRHDTLVTFNLTIMRARFGPPIEDGPTR